MKKVAKYAILRTLVKNNVWSDTMYSFISCTHIKDGETVLVGDPGICKFNDKLFSFPVLNKQFIQVKNLLEGEYYSCHVSKEKAPAFAEELLFIHETISPEIVENLVQNKLGIVCTGFSRTMFICKEDKAFNALYCYFALEAEALYDVEALLMYLKKNEHLNDTNNSALYELCRNHIQEKYVTGEDISTVISSPMEVPTFLRKIDSTLWSVHIARLLSEVPASPIIGGVASNCSSEFIKVYELQKNDSVVGLKVQLYAQEE